MKKCNYEILLGVKDWENLISKEEFKEMKKIGITKWMESNNITFLSDLFCRLGDKNTKILRITKIK